MCLPMQSTCQVRKISLLIKSLTIFTTAASTFSIQILSVWPYLQVRSTISCQTIAAGNQTQKPRQWMLSPFPGPLSDHTFPPFILSFSQDSGRGNNICMPDCTNLASAELVTPFVEHASEEPSHAAFQKKSAESGAIPTPSDRRRLNEASAWLVSGKPTLCKGFWAELLMSYLSRGEATHTQHLNQLSPSRITGIVEDKSIPFLQLRET